MAPRFDLDTIVIIDPDNMNLEDLMDKYVLAYLAQEDFIVFRQLNLIKKGKLLIPTNNNLYKETLLQEKDIILGICKEARWSI
ncbi:MAG: hypothetical protein EPO11_09440 [Gammaproteobacteria bacterium]|nr:MAG: hypothetical protein EPO11_09440 [Gammaproteobacteria bacterium]